MSEKRKVWKVVVRYEAEETIYVTAEHNWSARMVAGGGEEEYGDVLAGGEPEVVGKWRVKKATALRPEDVPLWLKAENGDLFDDGELPELPNV